MTAQPLSALIALRTAAGMAQPKAAAMIGITQSAYSKVERGVQTLSARDALTLARAFNVTVEELLGEAPQPRKADAASLTPAELLEAARAAMARPMDRKDISSWNAATAYLHLANENPRVEVFRVLFLDRKNRLIEHRVLNTGSVDHVAVYPAEVVRAALLLDASAIILCHNHPSGDPTPSAADLDMTRRIVKACKTLEIVVHDHIILGNGRDHSMTAAGQI